MRLIPRKNGEFHRSRIHQQSDDIRIGHLEILSRSALEPERAEAFHHAFVELYESYREGGRVRAPRRYLLTLGSRR